MKITTGIASTTHTDRHNDCMTKSALDGMAEQIKEKYIPHLIEHDWEQHIGVILYGEVFQLKDSEYALGVVFGLFESGKEKEYFKTTQPNIVWETYKSHLDIDELSKLIEENQTTKGELQNSKKTRSNIADLLETHLDSTRVLPDGTVYKIKRFIASTGDLRIEVYPKDHYPAHFHVISRQRSINARFSIEALEYISTKQGKITNSDIKKIRNFFETNPEVWEKLRSEHKKLQS